MDVSVLNGTGQADYLYGLISGLSKTPVHKIEILDIDLSSPLFDEFDNVSFQKVFTYQSPKASFVSKFRNLIKYYYLQIKHIVTKKPRVIHFQWLDRIYFFDRIIIPGIARMFGHTVILTVHNVNAKKRDNNDTLYNRLTLSILYKLCNHLIVHTPQSKHELETDFKIPDTKISIIKHGMNNKVQIMDLTQNEARRELNIENDRKVLLFFGNIDYYKGLDLLIQSVERLEPQLKEDILLLIAGNSKSPDYIKSINEQLDELKTNGKIIAHIQYIPDQDIEKYFMAADCIVLPYRSIYQSGVLFMAYNFGLPILATRVGNFENDIIPGKTGYLIDKIDPTSIAGTIQEYYKSQLYTDLGNNRGIIKEWSNAQFSWDKIGNDTFNLYQTQLNGSK
jgi:D-inositol-3-phosphate glycosyltransferase